MSIAFLDPELKRTLGYKDAKTRVYQGGREVLKGRDWTQRVKELQERSGGRCEYTTAKRWGWNGGFAQRCWESADDPHHNTLRSELRDDRLSRLTALCRKHHIFVDAQQREAKRRAKPTYRMVEPAPEKEAS